MDPSAVQDELDSALPPPAHSLSAKGHFALSSFWLAFNLHWGMLLMVTIPKQVDLIAPDRKAIVMGWIIGLGAIVGTLTPLIFGALSDRCRHRWGRRRPYMFSGVVINLVGLATMWWAGRTLGLGLYLAGYLVVQLGSNMATGAYSGLIPDLVPEDRRGEASGWMAAMSQVGTIIGVLSATILVGGLIIGSGNHFTAAYGVVAGMLVLFLAITMLGVRETPLACDPAPFRWGEFVRSLWVDPRRFPDFAWVWITRALVTMGMWTVQEYMQYYVGDAVGVKNPVLWSGLILLSGLVAATITGIIGGSLSDRIGRKRVVYTANTVIAIAAFAISFVHSLGPVFALAIVFGLGYGAYYSVDWALGCDVLPDKENPAKDMGIWHISMVLPQSLALPMAGAVLSAFGQTKTLGPDGPVFHYLPAGYTALFGLASGFLLLGALLLRNVRGVR